MFILTPLYLAFVLLLGIAGASKLRSPDQAALAVRAGGLPASRYALRGLGGFELILAAAAVFASTQYVDAAVCVMYVGFALFALRLVTANVTVSCGCFGGGDARASWPHVMMCGGAALVAGVEALAGPRSSLGTELLHLPSDGVAVAAFAIGAAAVVPTILEVGSTLVAQVNHAGSRRPLKEEPS